MHSVRDFGATGDGRALDHPAFQRTIDRCAEEGGGMVMVPPGRYRCGSMCLRSNVRLHLEAGAEIIGSADPADYESLAPTVIGQASRTTQALFWADEEDDVAVTGYGLIRGGGDSPLPGPEYLRTRFRPAVFLFRGCHGVRITDIDIKDSRYWTIHLLRCQDVRVRGITIANHRQRMASVGIVPDGSRDVLVSDCVIEAGDDAISVKSTGDEPCENIAVSNCVLRSSQAALKVGAPSVGTVRNVMCSNCIIERSHVGIGVYMKDGGVFENLSFCDLTIAADNEFPITIDCTPRHLGRDEPPGIIRDVRLSGITVHGRGRLGVFGDARSPIQRLTIRDLEWAVTGFCDGRRAVRNRGSEHADAPAAEGDRSGEPYQFLFTHVDGLRLADVACHLAVPLPDPDRGVLWLEAVRDAAVADLRGLVGPAGLPPMVARDCHDLHGLDTALRTHAVSASGAETGLFRAAVPAAR